MAMMEMNELTEQVIVNFNVKVLKDGIIRMVQDFNS
jgi:hypothetical protein